MSYKQLIKSKKSMILVITTSLISSSHGGMLFLENAGGNYVAGAGDTGVVQHGTTGVNAGLSWDPGGAMGTWDDFFGNPQTTPVDRGYVLVDNLSAGTFNYMMTNSNRLSEDVFFGGNRNFGMSADISLVSNGMGPASLDLAINKRSDRDRLAVKDLTNVSSFTITFNFSEPLAPASHQTHPDRRTLPFGVAMGSTNGSGHTALVDFSYDLMHVTGLVNGQPQFAAGLLDPTANGLDPAYTLSNSGNNSAILNTNNPGGVSQMLIRDTGNLDGTSWNLVSGIDLDNDGTIPSYHRDGFTQIIEEGETHYANSMTVTFTPETGDTFDQDATFFFSFNGSQHALTVPEPSSTFFFACGILGFSIRRKRLS